MRRRDQIIHASKVDEVSQILNNATISKGLMNNRKFGFNNHKSDNYANSVEELLIDFDRKDKNEKIIENILSISLPSKKSLIKFKTDIKEYSLFKDKQKIVITNLILRLQKYAYDKARQDSNNEILYSYKVIKYATIFFSKLLIASNKRKEENKINYIVLLHKSKKLFYYLRLIIKNKGKNHYINLHNSNSNVILFRRKKFGVHLISKFKEYININNTNNNVNKIGNLHYYHSYGLKKFQQWVTKLQNNCIIKLSIQNADKFHRYYNKNYSFKKMENNYKRNKLLCKIIKKDITNTKKYFMLKLSNNCRLRMSLRRKLKIAIHNDKCNSVRPYLFNWIDKLVNKYKIYGLISKGKKYCLKRLLKAVIKKLKLLLIDEKKIIKQIKEKNIIKSKSKKSLIIYKKPSVKRHLFNRWVEITNNSNWSYSLYQHAKIGQKKYLIQNSISKWIDFTTKAMINLKINHSQNVYSCLFSKKIIFQRLKKMLKTNKNTRLFIKEIDNRYHLLVYKSFLNKFFCNITFETRLRKYLILEKKIIIQRYFNKMANSKVNRLEVRDYHIGVINIMIKYYKSLAINKLKLFKVKSFNNKKETIIKNEILKIHLKKKYINQYIKVWRKRRKYKKYQLKFNQKAYNLRISHVGGTIITKWLLFVSFRHQIHHNSKSKATKLALKKGFKKILSLIVQLINITKKNLINENKYIVFLKNKISKFGFNGFLYYAHNRIFNKNQNYTAVKKYSKYLLKLSFNNIKMESVVTRKLLTTAVDYDYNKKYKDAISKLYSKIYFNRYFTNEILSLSISKLQSRSIKKLFKLVERKKDFKSNLNVLNNHFTLYSMFRFLQLLRLRVEKKQSVIISEHEKLVIADGIKADDFHIDYILHKSIQLLFENNLTTRLIQKRISTVKFHLYNIYFKRSFERFNKLVQTRRFNSHHYNIFYDRKTGLALKQWIKLAKISKNNRRKSFINNEEKALNLDEIVKQIEFNLNKGKKHRRRSSVSFISTVLGWSHWLNNSSNSSKSFSKNKFKKFEFIYYIERSRTRYLTIDDFKPWKLRVLQTIAIEWYFSNHMIKFINTIKNNIMMKKNQDIKVIKHDVHYRLRKSFIILRKLNINSLSVANKLNDIHACINNFLLKKSIKILLVYKKNSIAYRCIKYNKKRKVLANWSHLNKTIKFSRNLIRSIWLKKELINLKGAWNEWVTDTNFERMSENINKEIFINNKRIKFKFFCKKLLSISDCKKTVILYRDKKAMIQMQGFLNKIFAKISDRYKRLEYEDFYYNYHTNRISRIVLLNLKYCRINRISFEHLIKKQCTDGFNKLIKNAEVVNYDKKLMNIALLVFKKKIIYRWLHFIINNEIEHQNYIKRNKKSGLSNINVPPGVIANDWRLDRMKYRTLMKFRNILFLEPIRRQEIDEYADNQYIQLRYNRSFKKLYNNYKNNKIERKLNENLKKVCIERSLRTAIQKLDMNACAKWTRDQNLRILKKEKEKVMLRKGLRALEQLLIVTLY